MVNGKEQTQQNVVQVQNTHGTKKVEILQNGKVISSKEKPLTVREITNIQTRKFMPGLFSDCTPSISSRLRHRPSRRPRRSPLRRIRKTRKRSQQ